MKTKLTKREVMDQMENYIGRFGYYYGDDEFDYEYTDEAIEKIVDEWKNKKGSLHGMLSNHRCYNGRFQIVLTENFHRDPNHYAVRIFSSYIHTFFDIDTFVKKVIERTDRNIDQYDVDILTKFYPEFKVREGQRRSKVINRFCRQVLGLSGREYEQMFAKYSDAINPLDVQRYTIISWHPVDFLSMSNGNSWSSCHTIDKTGRDAVGDSYSGCYSSGTLSYMCDPSSFVVYVVDKSYDGEEWELQKKINRCMFHFGNQKLAQGRVYPQTCDDDDNGLYSQLRSTVQRVICECLDVPNLWTNSKYLSNAITEKGTHYSDLTNFSTCNISYYGSKASHESGEIPVNNEPVKIGSYPICIKCGKTHYDSECIMCEDCCEMKTCRYCACVIDSNDDVVIDVDTDNEYCCGTCANADDVYYCDNVGEWHSEFVFWDDYVNEYFYDYYDERITTKDGYVFMDEYNAREAGYIYTKYGWYAEDQVGFCEICGTLLPLDMLVDDLCEECREQEEEAV